jgi:hypothetical protein
MPQNEEPIKRFHPTRKVMRELEKRYSYEIEEIFGVIPSAFTANEANLLHRIKIS